MNPQNMNVLSEYARAARELCDLIGRLKGLRVRYAGLGMPESLTEADFTGELSHLTAGRVVAFLALVDALDGVLTGELETPAGKLPAGAVALAGAVR